MKISLALVSSLALTVAACGSSEEDSGAGAGGSGGINTSNLVGAPGVRVDGIAIYQGPKRTVMVAGEPQGSQIPLVVGRDSVVRVWYTSGPEYDGGEVVGELDLNDDKEPLKVLAPSLEPVSREENMATTINFGVPGDRIGDVINMQVRLLKDAPTDNAAARWPADGPHAIPVEGRRNTLRIVLVPLQYNADGSGRVPDISEEHIAEISGRFKSLYPVSNVELNVHAPVPFSSTISPTSGGGWNQVGFMLVSLRAQEGAGDDVYYYAMFDPADSITQYCGVGGCILGLTVLNNSPPSTGSAMLRGGMGIGFRAFAANTAAHEIGHSHGRRHAPCGPGVMDVDPAYPHAGGQLGEWAYDIVEGRLIQPVMTDIMGYCQNQFISDYNYIALHNRGQNVNLESFHSQEPVTYDVLGIEPDGSVTWGPTIDRARPYDGRRLGARVHHSKGTADVEARYLPWDHLPGGLLFVPRVAGKPTRVDVAIDGVPASATR